MTEPRNILITGASGFIGSFIVEEALRQGYTVWAGVRSSSSRQYLSDPRIHFAELDLSDVTHLCEQFKKLNQETGGGGWDYVIHAAGATKARRRSDFFRVNTEGTKNLVTALRQCNMTPKLFVFTSSLSVMGKNTHADMPHPNTSYGESKLMAEQFLATTKDFPYVILRPTGVYGPRERDYALMAQSIRRHVDFSVGFRHQDITFIYVRDFVSAIFRCVDIAASGNTKNIVEKAYFLTDGQVYTSRDFSLLLQQAMHVRHVLRIRCPLFLLWTICALSGTIARWLGRTTTLNLDKYHILAQRDWTCDTLPAQRDLAFHPEWSLARGVEETYAL
ncbi:MAG: NAD(P)-dependent oxidoreductase [Bacteroidales bacterium]|nr:NAD(P)-dependent oxidoreductase [Candidatus Physcousia equi]